MELLCKPHTFFAVAAAVGWTPVPHQRRKCFLREWVYPKKVTKLEAVRVVGGLLATEAKKVPNSSPSCVTATGTLGRD